MYSNRVHLKESEMYVNSCYVSVYLLYLYVRVCLVYIFMLFF